jgi:predicted MPP superfamily phosphohydrolase
VNLSVVLLICAIVAGLSGGVAARYRRWGTALADVFLGLLVASLFSIVAIVVLVLAAGLDAFGVLHFIYLLAVVAFPIFTTWIVLPQLIDAERRTPIIGWVLLIGSIMAASLGWWATHVEPFRLQVDTQILGARGAREPIVVGVIADLQTTSIASHERAALDAVLEAEPDIVVLPGDLFQLEPDQISDAIPEFIGWLRTLTDTVDHVVLVNGNADDAEIVEELADESGAIYLSDAITQLRVSGQTVTVVGLAYTPDRDPATLDPALLAEIKNSLVEDDFVLAVSHHPDAVLSFPRSLPIDLLIAGHTHGGQIALPRIGPLFTFSDLPNVVAAGGLHVVNGHPIYVSTGVGLERGQAPQVRLGVPPSVGILTVVPS